MTLDELKKDDQTYVSGAYARFDLAIREGKNAVCWDYDGKRYVDFGSGIGVNSLGFADDKWIMAVAEQAKRFAHCSNLYYSEPCIRVAKTLCERTGMKKAFFQNSGAEANEAMIKAARKYSHDHYGDGRHEIVSLVNSFHGRTVTTLTATGQEGMHKDFAPFTGGFVYAKANDAADLGEKVSEKTCAILVELVQGEGGVVPLDRVFVDQVAKLCEKEDILLLIDEVQTGVGRTGSLYAFEQFGLSPDLVSTAKGLGGGLPIGAVLFGEKTKDVFGPGDHGSTFGGNAAVCAGAAAVLERMDEAFLKDVRRKGERIREKLMGLSNVETVSGLGMMLGVSLKKGTGKEAAVRCLERGLIVLTAKERIRLLPPLTIGDAELEEGLSILCSVIESF